MNEVQPTIVRVREGQIADTESWLYAWFNARTCRVVYVGGTGMSPQLRVWLHLNDSNPGLGRIKARYQRFNTEPLDVLAFPLPVEVPRPAAKAALIAKLSVSGLLGDDYVGDAPRAVEASAEESLMRHVETFVRQIRSYLEVDLTQ